MTENLALVYENAMANYNSELVDAQADYARAEAAGDLGGQVYASQRIADVRVRAQEFDRMAQQHARAYLPQTGPTKDEILGMSHERLVASGQGSEMLAAAGVFGPEVTPEVIRAEKAKRGWR